MRENSQEETSGILAVAAGAGGGLGSTNLRGSLLMADHGDQISLEGWWGKSRFRITNFSARDFPPTPAGGGPMIELHSQTLYPEIASDSRG